MRASRAIAGLCLAGLCMAGCTQPAVQRPAGQDAPVAPRGYADVVERVSPSVVSVRTRGGIGSGVVFRPDVVLTNQHVVAGQATVVIGYADGSESPGTVLAADRVTDLAVVRTTRTGLPVAEFRRDLPRPGDPVLTLGSPLGFQNTVAAGIVSGLHREIPGSATRSSALVDLIQTDAPISPGNSGGALLDATGRVIGINEAYIPPDAGAVSIGFAIPAATAEDVANQLLRDGRATHPYLGVSLSPVTPAIRERLGVRIDHGALVHGVENGGPGASAGLRAGDVIVEFNGNRVNGVEDVLGALRGTSPGQRVTLTVVRGAERVPVAVTVGARAG